MRTVSFFMLVALVVSLHPGEAASPPPALNHVVIRLYNIFGVPDEAIGRAHRTAGSILGRAGIESTWQDCVVPTGPSRWASDPCDDVPRGEAVLVRVISTPDSVPDRRTLGYSYVDVEIKSGVLSAVFADRIESMARRTRSDFSSLLGRAMAHEVGHLLLGTTSHSTKGLMRAQWLDSELLRDVPSDWSFSKDESSAMRSSLVARMRMATPAVAITAAKGP